jgi:hypothetical protein
MWNIRVNITELIRHLFPQDAFKCYKSLVVRGRGCPRNIFCPNFGQRRSIFRRLQRLQEICKLENLMNFRESNSRPSGLQHSVSNNYIFTSSFLILLRTFHTYFPYRTHLILYAIGLKLCFKCCKHCTMKRNHYYSDIRLIREPKFIMLLIILLGAIFKLAAVLADCDIGSTTYKTTDWSNVSYSVVSVNLSNENMQEKDTLMALLCSISLQAPGTGCTTSHRNITRIWTVLCPRLRRSPRIWAK